MNKIFKKKNLINLFFFLFLISYFEILTTIFKILKIEKFAFMYFSVDLKFLIFAFIIFIIFFFYQINKLDFVKKNIKIILFQSKIELLILLIIFTWVTIDLYHYSYTGDIDLKHQFQLLLLLVSFKFFKFILNNKYNYRANIGVTLKFILYLNLLYTLFFFINDYGENTFIIRKFLEPYLNWAAFSVPHNFTDMSILAYMYLFMFFRNGTSTKEFLLFYLLLFFHILSKGSDFAVMQLFLITFLTIYFYPMKFQNLYKILSFLVISAIIIIQQDLHLKFKQLIWMSGKGDQQITKIIENTYTFDTKYNSITTPHYYVKESFDDPYYRGHILRYLASISSLAAFKNNPFIGSGAFDISLRAKKHYNVEDENYFTRILSSYGIIGGFLIPLFVLIRIYFLLIKKFKKFFVLIITFFVFSLPSEGYFHHSNSIFLNEMKTK